MWKRNAILTSSNSAAGDHIGFKIGQLKVWGVTDVFKKFLDHNSNNTETVKESNLGLAALISIPVVNVSSRVILINDSLEDMGYQPQLFFSI